MSRYFTVAEANALLPVLRPHIAQLIQAWRRLTASQAKVSKILEDHPHVDLGGPPLTQAAVDLIRSQNAMMAIQALGVDLKDPVTGLIDFPTLRNGVEVCLCWQYDEPEVAFWHSLESGFAGRQPLDED
jgi:hypothetical protein